MLMFGILRIVNTVYFIAGLITVSVDVGALTKASLCCITGSLFTVPGEAMKRGSFAKEHLRRSFSIGRSSSTVNRAH